MLKITAELSKSNLKAFVVVFVCFVALRYGLVGRSDDLTTLFPGQA